MIVVLLLTPFVATEYFVSAILTQALWLGIAAASLIFLAGYGGMVSLARSRCTASRASRTATWSRPTAASTRPGPVGRARGRAAGRDAGRACCSASSSRSEGIYFLMITLALGVIVYLFWGKVTDLSGFGGLNDIASPSVVDNPTTEPNGLYYVVVGCCVPCSC